VNNNTLNRKDSCEISALQIPLTEEKILLKGIVSGDWVGLQMILMDRCEVQNTVLPDQVYLFLLRMFSYRFLKNGVRPCEHYSYIDFSQEEDFLQSKLLLCGSKELWRGGSPEHNFCGI
jgi:hypothetical protein